MRRTIHEEIIKALKAKDAQYSRPLNSETLAKLLHINPSYARLQASLLKDLIGVRRGKGGGYYLKSKD